MDVDVDPPFFVENPLTIYPFSCNKVMYSLSSDFFSDGNKICRNNTKQLAIDIDDENLLHKSFPEFPCKVNNCRKTFTSVQEYEMHYQMCHSFICTSCKKSFPSYFLLDHHLDEVHGYQFGAKKTSDGAVFSCLVLGCDEFFTTSQDRKEHCIKVHLYPANFYFCPEKPSLNDPSSFQKHRFTQKAIKKDICFGRGAERCFVSRKKTKDLTFAGDISMKEISDSLSEL